MRLFIQAGGMEIRNQEIRLETEVVLVSRAAEHDRKGNAKGYCYSFHFCTLTKKNPMVAHCVVHV